MLSNILPSITKKSIVTFSKLLVMLIFLTFGPIITNKLQFRFILLVHSWVTPLVTKVISVLTSMAKSLSPKMLFLMKTLFHMLLQYNLPYYPLPIFELFLLELYPLLLTLPLGMLLKNPLFLLFQVSLTQLVTPILNFLL